MAWIIDTNIGAPIRVCLPSSSPPLLPPGHLVNPWTRCSFAGEPPYLKALPAWSSTRLSSSASLKDASRIWREKGSGGRKKTRRIKAGRRADPGSLNTKKELRANLPFRVLAGNVSRFSSRRERERDSMISRRGWRRRGARWSCWIGGWILLSEGWGEGERESDNIVRF